MPIQRIINEIKAPAEKVWELLINAEEFALWAPNVRELSHVPKKGFGVDTERHFRLDVSGKIQTLNTRVTHYTEGSVFTESPVGGSMKLHEKVKHLKITYRIEAVEPEVSSLTATIDYEMKGFAAKMLEKIIMGTFISQLRLWFERLTTYAETGRPV